MRQNSQKGFCRAFVPPGPGVRRHVTRTPPSALTSVFLLGTVGLALSTPVTPSVLAGRRNDPFHFRVDHQKLAHGRFGRLGVGGRQCLDDPRVMRQ